MTLYHAHTGVALTSAENRGQRVRSRVHMWKIQRNQSTTGLMAFIYLPVLPGITTMHDAQWKVRARSADRARSTSPPSPTTPLPE